MTYWTNYAENILADKMRGTAPTYPTNWYIAYGSAATDSSFTEITGADLPRVAVARSLVKWAGTQGAGTTLASTGTSHATSNNDAITFSTAASDRGTAAFVGLFDALSGGNCWAYAPISELIINNGDTPTIASGNLSFVVGSLGVSDYLSNKLVDEFFRGQAYSWPATTYMALYTTAPTNAGGGTEVSGGSYARASLASTTTAISGTQSAGSTSASSGSGGRISNNVAVTYPAPTGNWGDVVAEGQKDASTSGNLLTWGAFGSARSILTGSAAPSHAPNSLGFTIS